MPNFSGRVALPTATPMTISQLVRAGIDARDLTAAQKSAEKSRWLLAVCVEGFVKPQAAGVYMLNAFKGVRNGDVIAADWSAGDFTAANGGGERLEANVSRHLDRLVELGNRVLYQETGADVALDLDLTIN